MKDRFRFKIWLKYSERLIDIDKKENDLYSFLENVNDRYVIIQSTGLRDFENNLIYENDIVQLKVKNYINNEITNEYIFNFICEYDNGTYYFKNNIYSISLEKLYNYHKESESLRIFGNFITRDKWIAQNLGANKYKTEMEYIKYIGNKFINKELLINELSNR